MAAASPFEMFGEGAKKKARPKKAPPQPATPPPAADPAKPPPADDEVAEMIAKMKRMREDLDGRMLDLMAKSGVTGDTVDRYLAGEIQVNPSIRQIIDDKIETFSKETSRQLGKDVIGGVSKIKQEKAAKKRGKKFLGKRQKWLEM